MATTTMMMPYHHVGVAPTIGGGSGRDRPTIIIVTTSRQKADDGASRSEKQQTTRTRRRRRRSYSHPLDTRTSLVLALASQASSLSQRVISELATETAKYVFPRKSQPRNLEEALMSVPDLETVNFEVLKQTQRYDIRQVQAYFIAETKMPGNTGFGFNGSSQAFNVLAAYLFGKNTKNEEMEMTTPVYTRKVETKGEKMEMTTPVITRQSSDNWQMSFVLPSKYGANLPSPKDASVRIREVPSKIVAVTAFSGFVTDEEVSLREARLRDALRNDTEFQVKPDALVEVAQFNPPFTLPFTRRNEISLDVERRKK